MHKKCSKVSSKSKNFNITQSSQSTASSSASNVISYNNTKTTDDDDDDDDIDDDDDYEDDAYYDDYEEEEYYESGTSAYKSDFGQFLYYGGGSADKRPTKSHATHRGVLVNRTNQNSKKSVKIAHAKQIPSGKSSQKINAHNLAEFNCTNDTEDTEDTEENILQERKVKRGTFRPPTTTAAPNYYHLAHNNNFGSNGKSTSTKHGSSGRRSQYPQSKKQLAYQMIKSNKPILSPIYASKSKPAPPIYENYDVDYHSGKTPKTAVNNFSIESSEMELEPSSSNNNNNDDDLSSSKPAVCFVKPSTSFDDFMRLNAAHHNQLNRKQYSSTNIVGTKPNVNLVLMPNYDDCSDYKKLTIPKTNKAEPTTTKPVACMANLKQNNNNYSNIAKVANIKHFNSANLGVKSNVADSSLLTNNNTSINGDTSATKQIKTYYSLSSINPTSAVTSIKQQLNVNDLYAILKPVIRPWIFNAKVHVKSMNLHVVSINLAYLGSIYIPYDTLSNASKLTSIRNSIEYFTKVNDDVNISATKNLNNDDAWVIKNIKFWLF